VPFEELKASPSLTFVVISWRQLDVLMFARTICALERLAENKSGREDSSTASKATGKFATGSNWLKSSMAKTESAGIHDFTAA
jgi:hypothetical protein